MKSWDMQAFEAALDGADWDFGFWQQKLWEYQRMHNPYLQQLYQRIKPEGRFSLPIRFFKEFSLQTGGEWPIEAVFESSGTTGQTPSRHLVRDLGWYDRNVMRGFHAFFDPGPYRILGLLPSYLERGNSSLVRMVQVWIEQMGTEGSGFFLHDFEALRSAIREATIKGERILLIGVAFALLDFADEGGLNLPPNSIVIETGGMKGRREELTRPALHARLRNGLGIPHIHSEYGMTEMLSQAYTGADGRFRPSPTLQVRISDLHLDRLTLPYGRTGRIHLVDLANVHSCAFIATDDLGRQYEDGSFEVLGRIDNAELRGCSLMYVG